jgi:hypothetical protein
MSVVLLSLCPVAPICVMCDRVGFAGSEGFFKCWEKVRLS